MTARDIDPNLLKLGKTKRPPDRRTLRWSTYGATVDPAPASYDLGTKTPGFGMHLNDQLGCCVIAAGANQIEADSDDNGNLLVIPDGDVLAGYEACAGYVPGNASTDNGTDPLTFMQWWQKTGLGGRKIYAYVNLDPTNIAEVRNAGYYVGGIQIAVDLPITAQAQFSQRQPWDVVGDGKTGNSAPGSWGGHMVYGRGFATNGNLLIETWDELQEVTPAFLATYGDPNEQFAAIPWVWVNGQGQAPNGFNLGRIQADLAAVTGTPDPNPQPVVTDVAAPLWQSLVSIGQYELANPNPAGDAAELAVIVGACNSWIAWLQANPQTAARQGRPALALPPVVR